ncbi:MerR family DNA-binding transcriptional regulator [Terasakiella sp. A23]|uniref:MerR family transcriptional regulator n=1 Tax=Terasakiella sp. FCG-A23 TaxID=3080561 RepID=UPI0029557ADA|nr:MerR family DNA-binding transcriptional regulator [Terasakiella sp. A23]MDV7341546.1 MerR family DNA-binding transcriptional regulator [Terasakiella sp. A23]
MSDEEFFSVPQLAKELGITPRAIRFYETKGLLTPARAGATRVYTKRDRARLILILRGKRLGFSLAEIHDFLDLYESKGKQGDQLQLLVRKVRNRIKDLEEQRIELDRVLNELKNIEKQSLATLGPDFETEVAP